MSAIRTSRSGLSWLAAFSLSRLAAFARTPAQTNGLIDGRVIQSKAVQVGWEPFSFFSPDVFIAPSGYSAIFSLPS
jgi:hypothetical protein